MTHRHAIMKHVPTLKVPKFEDIYDKVNFNYTILGTPFCNIILSVSEGGFILTKTTSFNQKRVEFITVNSSCEETNEDKEKLKKNYDKAYQQIQDWYRGLYDELLKAAGC